jgi:hypothetical protein
VAAAVVAEARLPSMRTVLRTGSLVMAALCIGMGLVIAIPSTLLVGGGVLLHGRLDWSVVTLVFGLGMAAIGVWAFRWDPSHRRLDLAPGWFEGRRRPVVSSPPPTGDRAWLAIGPR